MERDARISLRNVQEKLEEEASSGAINKALVLRYSSYFADGEIHRTRASIVDHITISRHHMDRSPFSSNILYSGMSIVGINFKCSLLNFYSLFVIDTDNIRSLVKLHSVESTRAKKRRRAYI